VIAVLGSSVAPKNAARSLFNLTGLLNPFASAILIPYLFYLFIVKI
jgi:hypothetical protein